MAEWTLASVCQRGLEKMGVCKKDGKRMEMALKKKKRICVQWNKEATPKFRPVITP